MNTDFTDFRRFPLKFICIRLAFLFLLSLLLISGTEAAQAQEDLPQNLIRKVGFDQRLDEQVPAELRFTDSLGQPARLGDYFGDKPIILTLGYYECPMLCSLVRNGLFESMERLKLDVGQDYELLVVSIDPSETAEIAEAKRRASIMEYGRSTATDGWNFLVGEADSIEALADSIGFRYAYDPNLEQYAHPSGIVLLTPEGKIARYLYGIEFPTTDLRLGLVEAAANEIGSPVDQLLLTCYHYDPVSGEYTLAIMTILRGIGLTTVLIVGGLLFVMLRRDWDNSAPPSPA